MKGTPGARIRHACVVGWEIVMLRVSKTVFRKPNNEQLKRVAVVHGLYGVCYDSGSTVWPKRFLNDRGALTQYRRNPIVVSPYVSLSHQTMELFIW